MKNGSGYFAITAVGDNGVSVSSCLFYNSEQEAIKYAYHDACNIAYSDRLFSINVIGPDGKPVRIEA